MEKPPKDPWDKLAAASSLLSGVVVAAIGFYATNVYNRRQRNAEVSRKERELLVAQVQTVEKFIPHLSGQSEAAKSAALIAIAALGNEELAVKLARSFGGEGSTSALANIAKGSGAGAQSATRALSELFDYLRPRLTTIHVDGVRRASGFLATDDGIVVTTAHAVEDVSSGKVDVGFSSGQLIPGAMLSLSKKLDLAIIKIAAPAELPFMAVRPGAPEVGTRVIALMIDIDGALEARVGSVLGLGVSSASETVQLENRVLVQLAVTRGSSGTPVLDEAGRLVGVVQASDHWSQDSQNRVYLIPAGDLAQFVQASRSGV